VKVWLGVSTVLIAVASAWADNPSAACSTGYSCPTTKPGCNVSMGNPWPCCSTESDPGSPFYNQTCCMYDCRQFLYAAPGGTCVPNGWSCIDKQLVSHQHESVCWSAQCLYN
jgi:hypothetical protein